MTRLARRKPTIEDLERMLNEGKGDAIRILPNGQITVGVQKRSPARRKPRPPKPAVERVDLDALTVRLARAGRLGGCIALDCHLGAALVTATRRHYAAVDVVKRHPVYTVWNSRDLMRKTLQPVRDAVLGKDLAK